MSTADAEQEAETMRAVVFEDVGERMEVLQPEFEEYAAQVVRNAETLGDALRERGFSLVSGGCTRSGPSSGRPWTTPRCRWPGPTSR